MFNKIVYSVFLSLVALHLTAQFDHGCDGVRYVNEVFTDIGQDTHYYGKNVKPDGDSVNLFLDVFYPQNDDADARPFILFAHGGAFIGGTRDEQFANCERFAKLGYVAATFDYRLLNIVNGIPDSIGSMDIAVKAAHDMKGALRWFKNSIATGNEYNIDPDMFFIGGYSAGAITALIAGVLDEEEVDKQFLIDILENNGGFDGNTGDPAHLTYDIDIQGIYNLSGAVYDTSWIDVNDPVIVSYHGNSDQTVGYNLAYATVFGVQIIQLHGSGNIIHRTVNLGIPGYLHTVEGGDHTDIYFGNQFQADLDIFTGASDTIFAEIICNGPLVSSKEIETSYHNIFPNPATDFIQFEGVPANSLLEIFDVTGRRIKQYKYEAGKPVNVQSLIGGLYTYRILATDFYAVGQLLISK